VDTPTKKLKRIYNIHLNNSIATHRIVPQTMISTRLTTTNEGFLSHTFIPENTRQMIERRLMGNKKFGKLELKVPMIDRVVGTKRKPRNIVIGFLLDISGSMQGTKLMYATNTIKKLVEVVLSERNGKTIEDQPFHAWIYVITFDSDAQLVIPFQEITDETVPKIIEHLDHIRTKGSTDYERAFQKQTEVIEDILAKLNETHQRHDDHQLHDDQGHNDDHREHYHFLQFFETDGEITQGSKNIEKLYAMMRNTSTSAAAATPTATTTTTNASIRLTFEYYTIGYGTDVDLDCLKSLASPYPPLPEPSAKTAAAGTTNPDYSCSTLATILKPDDISWQVGEILFKVIMRYANKVEVGVSVVGPATATSAATMPGTIEIFEYQTHQWGSSTTLHSLVHGENKALWVQYTPDIPDAVGTSSSPIQIHVEIKFENQFTGEDYTCTFEHEIHDASTDVQSLVPDLPAGEQQEPPVSTETFQKVISLILGMAQIEIFKQFREVEAGRYDKDTIVHEAYKTIRMLYAIDTMTRLNYPVIASQTLNLITDVKVIIGTTTINNAREETLVLHARRICSAEQSVFNTGAEVSRRYVEFEEDHEEHAKRVIKEAKKANGETNATDVGTNGNQYDNDDDEYEEMNDALPSRIPTMMPQNFDTPFAVGGSGASHGNRKSNRRNISTGSELRTLCVKIALARKNKEDITAEDLYKQMCLRPHSCYQYDPDCDAPGQYDDTFSSTPMDDEYTQRRMGMMRQMSSS